ncbi:MAG: tetratricopeptide repeat protein, partial [Chthoniobacterales bacterium]
MSQPGNETQTVTEELAPPRAAGWKSWLLGLLLVAATAVAYQPAWNAGFIWDDDIYVTTNELLTAPDGLQRIWFSFDSPSQYFPLVYTTFRFEHALWGLNPAGYHLVNLALHIATALLAWRLLFLLRIPGSWLAAALFALHPVNVESVAWITERKNVLMGFFFLLALIAYQKFVARRGRGEWKFYALALLCYTLSLASKTTACTMPAALFLLLWWKRERISKARVLQIVPFVLLGLGAGLLTIWWERYHQGTEGGIFSIGIAERFLVAARAFWFYLGKLIWPADLAFSYPRRTISTGDGSDYLWLTACLVLALAIWGARRFLGRGPEVAMVFFLAMLSPMLGFVMLYTFRYSFVADHYVYLASIGPFALVAGALITGLKRIAWRPEFFWVVICSALLLPLGYRTWRQSAAYENPETLWRATLAVNPASWMAQNNLAIDLLHRGRNEEAIGHFEEALRLDPNYAEAHYNLGNALFRLGRIDEARARYVRALQLFPDYASARNNFAVLLLQTGEIPAAVEQLEAVVKIAPRDAAARQLLGSALLQIGRPEEAISQLRAALEIDPHSSAAHSRLAAAYFQLGRIDEASAQAERLVATNPKSPAVLTEAGLILAALGQDAPARVLFEKALQLDPQNAEAHHNLANALLAERQIDEAMTHYRRAVEIKPDYTAARLNLGNVLMESGQLEGAIEQYEEVIRLQPDYALAHRNMASALNSLGRFDEGMAQMEAAWKIEAKSGG